MIKISLLHVTDSVIPEVKECSWRDIVDLLAAYKGRRYIDKKSAPMFSPTVFRDNRRLADKAIDVHFAVIDLDHVSRDEFQFVKNRLFGFNYYVYTTYSHTKAKEIQGEYSVRFLIELSKPVKAAEWEPFWKRLNSFLNGVMDQSCKDVSRCYFVPSCANTADQWDERNHGVPLDVDGFFNKTVEDLKPKVVNKRDVEALIKKLESKKSAHSKKMIDALQKATLKQPMASHGDRDNTYFKLADLLDREFSNLDPETIVKFFEPSLEAAQSEGSKKSGTPDFIKKIERARERRIEQEEKLKEELSLQHSQYIKNAFKGERDYPYTQEELEYFYEKTGVDADTFKFRWIIGCREMYYLFFDGKYIGPISEKNLSTTARDYLAPAITAGVYVKQPGKSRDTLKPAKVLLEDYGTATETVVADLCAQESWFDDKNNKMIEAPCPIRKELEPKYSEDVNTFLSLLCGNQLDAMLDFMAAVTKLDKPCASIYLHAEPNSGKSLLVNGLSSLWRTTGPADFESVSGAFNGEIVGCPLVFADETLPAAFTKNADSGALRQLIAKKHQTLRRKFLPDVKIHGSVRYMFAANNEKMLDGMRDRREKTDADIRAITERIVFIQCKSFAARNFLQKLGEARCLDFQHFEIAQHALWLRDNRALKSNRFILENTDDSFSRRMKFNSETTNQVCEWLVKYLQNPKPIDNRNGGKIFIKDGNLFVNSSVFQDHWTQYMTTASNNIPDRSDLITAIKNISQPTKVMKNPATKKSTRYNEINKEDLFSWIDLNDLATREEIEEALSKDTPQKVLMETIKGAIQ